MGYWETCCAVLVTQRYLALQSNSLIKDKIYLKYKIPWHKQTKTNVVSLTCKPADQLVTRSICE